MNGTWQSEVSPGPFAATGHGAALLPSSSADSSGAGAESAARLRASRPPARAGQDGHPANPVRNDGGLAHIAHTELSRCPAKLQAVLLPPFERRGLTIVSGHNRDALPVFHHCVGGDLSTCCRGFSWFRRDVLPGSIPAMSEVLSVCWLTLRFLGSDPRDTVGC